MFKHGFVKTRSKLLSMKYVFLDLVISTPLLCWGHLLREDDIGILDVGLNMIYIDMGVLT